MADFFAETVVKRKPMPSGKLFQNLLAAVAIFNVILAIGNGTFFWIAAAVAGVAWYLLKQNVNVEYEYIHANEELDIDKVIANSSRKHIMTVNLGRVDILAPMGNGALRPYEGLKKRDYSAKDPECTPYVMVCDVKGSKCQLILQMDDKMLKSLKKSIPGKVISE